MKFDEIVIRYLLFAGSSNFTIRRVGGLDVDIAAFM